MRLLDYACRYHTQGWLDAPGAVQVCWDADRLDLWRVGTRPDPSRLCTRAARRIAHGFTSEGRTWVRDPGPARAVQEAAEDFWRKTARAVRAPERS